MKNKFVKVLIVSLVVCFAVSLFAFSVSADEVIYNGVVTFTSEPLSGAFTSSLAVIELGKTYQVSSQYGIFSGVASSESVMGLEVVSFYDESVGTFVYAPALGLSGVQYYSEYFYNLSDGYTFNLTLTEITPLSDQIGSFVSNMFSLIGISANSIGSNSILSIFLIGLPLLFIVIGILFTLLNRKKNRGRRGYYKRYKRR